MPEVRHGEVLPAPPRQRGFLLAAAPFLGGAALLIIGAVAMIVPVPIQQSPTPAETSDVSRPEPVNEPLQADQ